MEAFSGIVVDGLANVILAQGEQSSVMVRSENREAFDRLVVYVEDSMLYITTKSVDNFNQNLDGITIYVTTPIIRSVEIAGSGDITTTTPITTGNVSVKIAGSGNIDFADSMLCNNLNAEIDGSGNIHFKHVTASKVNTSITGSGDVTYDNLIAGNADSEIDGSGNITLRGKVAQHTEDVSGNGNIDTSGVTR